MEIVHILVTLVNKMFCWRYVIISVTRELIWSTPSHKRDKSILSLGFCYRNFNDFVDKVNREWTKLKRTMGEKCNIRSINWTISISSNMNASTLRAKFKSRTVREEETWKRQNHFDCDISGEWSSRILSGKLQALQWIGYRRGSRVSKLRRTRRLEATRQEYETVNSLQTCRDHERTYARNR